MPIRFAADCEQYARDHKELMQERLDVHYEARRLIEIYGNILTQEEKTKAMLIIWNSQNVNEYRNMFLYLILEGYRVWEMTAKDLERRYEFIVANNPYWAKEFAMDYKRKVKQCKVPLPYVKTQTEKVEAVACA